MAECISGLVSVVIPVHNRARLLGRAVDSVLAQTYPHYEIIIVDDGSTDDTPQAAAALAQAHPDRIRVLAQPNRGPGPAREQGRLAARGEFIQYVDSDDLLDVQKLERQVAMLAARPECDAVYGVTRLVDDQGAVLREPYRWTGEDRSALYPGLLVDRWWSTHTPLWRRSFSDRVGPWSSLRYSEDWEYEARAGGLGARLCRVPQVVCDVRSHAHARETGSGRWLDPADQVVFFRAILEGATASGVAVDTPEMRHFSRWTFAASRAAALRGDKASAQALLGFARRSAEGRPLDMAVYGLAGRVFGYSSAARLLAFVHRLSGRRKGKDTQLQSWMDGEGD